MNRKLAGLIALLIAVPGAAITFGDFRAGRARLWVSGGVRPFTAERLPSPALFWIYTAVNALFLAALLAVALFMVAVP